jgi:DNA-binding LytR/AlgR family response regulator
MSLRALVVDDERPALEELRYCLREADPTVEVELAATALDALRLLKQHRFDAVFVDIQMPGLSGLELVDLVHEFDAPPAVVFVTAYEEYALRAFELRAVDYLLKPVALDRLRETLERLRGGHRRPAVEAEPASRAARLDKLPVETAGRTVLIDLPDIRYAEARAPTTASMERASRCTSWSAACPPRRSCASTAPSWRTCATWSRFAPTSTARTSSR